MKRLLCGLFGVLLLLLLITPNTESPSEEGDVAASLTWLRSQESFTFGNVVGSAIPITAEMLRAVSGEDTESIRIQTIPKEVNGRLEAEGRPLAAEEEILLQDLDAFTFIPHHQGEIHESFSFCKNGTDTVYHCRIVLAESEPKPIEIACAPLSTYKNVSVTGRIQSSAKDEGVLRITKGCKNGVLTQTDPSGAFRYTPKRNFTGTDSFTCLVYDGNGNQSRELRVSIQVTKAEQNLYFYDCLARDEHKNAIELCCADVMSYHLDEDGLPVFLPEQTVTEREFLLMLKAMKDEESIRAGIDTPIGDRVLGKSEAYGLALGYLSGKLYYYEAFSEKEIQEPAEEPLTRADCATLLATLMQDRISDSRN